jgi:alanyl-tRNA synthetase
MRDEKSDSIIVLASIHENKPSVLVVVPQYWADKGYNAGKIANEMAKKMGGGGGGKPTMAQAGGKDPSKIEEALEKARDMIKQQGK